MRRFASLLLLFLPMACQDETPSPALPVVPKVDLARYMGTWYEIAKYPNRFQKGCDSATAQYSLRTDGTVEVLNRCLEPDGKARKVNGRAWVVDPATNAKLKVRFFWPFSGDYWIVDLGKDYEYAVASEPRRKYLWILGRDLAMPKPVLDGILERLRANGFDTEKLTFSSRTSRSAAPSPA